MSYVERPISKRYTAREYSDQLLFAENIGTETTPDVREGAAFGGAQVIKTLKTSALAAPSGVAGSGEGDPTRDLYSFLKIKMPDDGTQYTTGGERYGLEVKVYDDGTATDNVTRTDSFGIFIKSRSKVVDQGGVGVKLSNFGSTDAMYMYLGLKPIDSKATLPTGFGTGQGSTGIGVDVESAAPFLIPTIRYSTDPNSQTKATKGLWLLGSDKFLDGTTARGSGRQALPFVLEGFNRSVFQGILDFVEISTTLSAASAAGATTITVVSATNFAINDIIEIGKGTVDAEWRKITAISVNTFTLDIALDFAHASGQTVSQGTPTGQQVFQLQQYTDKTRSPVQTNMYISADGVIAGTKLRLQSAGTDLWSLTRELAAGVEKMHFFKEADASSVFEVHRDATNIGNILIRPRTADPTSNLEGSVAMVGASGSRVLKWFDGTAWRSSAIASDSIPLGLPAGGSGSAGTDAKLSRTDHVHPIGVSNPLDLVAGASAGGGTSTTFVRSDHAHGVPVGTPVAIGTANSAGTSGLFVRADHVHAHPAFGSGDLHTEYGAIGQNETISGAWTFSGRPSISSTRTNITGYDASSNHWFSRNTADDLDLIFAINRVGVNSYFLRFKATSGGLIPDGDNIGSVGTAANRWSLVRAVTITPGDLVFENGWRITEAEKLGLPPGLAFVRPDGSIAHVLH